MQQDVLIAYCTCPDQPSAERIAGALIDRRLAACVNLLPGVRSFFRWEGQVEDEREELLLIKTTEDRMPALRDAIAELHPYDVPELIAVRIADGLAPYTDWVREESTGE
jgi:periplasmic divalent cation tolerance protein